MRESREAVCEPHEQMGTIFARLPLKLQPYDDGFPLLPGVRLGPKGPCTQIVYASALK